MRCSLGPKMRLIKSTRISNMMTKVKKGVYKIRLANPDILVDKNGLNVLLRHSGVIEPSQIFCDKIEYIHDHGTFKDKPIFDHHLMFWSKGNLIFKVWLPNTHKDKEYECAEDALNSIGGMIRIEKKGQHKMVRVLTDAEILARIKKYVTFLPNGSILIEWPHSIEPKTV